MFYGLENGTRRDDICSMCDDRLQPTKWKMAQAAFLFILKDSAQLCEQVFADIESCLHEGWLTRVLNLYSTGRGKGLTFVAPPPLSCNIWRSSISTQTVVEVGAALLC